MPVTPDEHPTVVDAGGWRLRMPMVWPDVRVAGGGFPVPREAMESVMPSPDLRPALTPRGDALLLVEVTRQPVFAATLEDGRRIQRPQLAACLVAAVVTYRSSPSRFSALALGRAGSPTGLLELHFPLTSGSGRDVGRQTWGEPKFIADFAFTLDTDGGVRAVVSEAGREILTLALTRPGRLSPFRSDTYLYCASTQRLSRFRYVSRGWRSMSLARGRATLELGDHPVAAEIAALRPRPASYLAFTMHDELDEQYPTEDIGPAARTATPYAGADVVRGGLTLQAPGLDTVDLCAGLPEALFTQGHVTG